MSHKTRNVFTVTRRHFIKAGGTTAAALCVGSASTATAAEAPLDPRWVQQATATRRTPETRTVHSVCLACNARCGARGVVQNGRLVNISGNPYHPYNMQFTPIAYDTPLDQSLATPSPVCGKALDTPQHIYSPYRLRTPLKRSGPRGSGQFEPIAWPDLIREIAEGGALFQHLGEDRRVPGISELISDDPIDPADPSLGPKRNGLVFLTGRLQSGRKEFIDRFVKQSVGSRNRIGHTDICGLGFRMGNFALSDGKAVELKADPKNADYILVFGANIYEALQPGINTYGAMVARRRADGKLAFSIVDPRATRASAHAKDWLAVKPGKDGALAMAMIRWMMENDRINRDYLGAPNPAAVKKRGYGVLCNASHLVICDPGHADDGQFLRARHLDPALGGDAAEDRMVFTRDEKMPISALSTDRADLEREAIVEDYFGNPIRVKTAYQLLKEAAFAHDLGDYAATCGVPLARIERVAGEFSSHGTRAAVTQYHGAGNYVNGTYAAYAVAALNALVGSVNMKGGYLTGGGGCGKPTGGLYDLKTVAGSVKAGDVAISRENAVYEKSAEYRRKKSQTGSGYPARRPWFAFTKGGLCVEALSGIDQQYPYPHDRTADRQNAGRTAHLHRDPVDRSGNPFESSGFRQGRDRRCKGGRHDLLRAEDFYLRAFANIAAGAKLPPAHPAEVADVEAAYTLAAHKAILSTALIRPGCVAIAFHFGHSGFGATALSVRDGKRAFLGGAAVIDADGRLKADPAFGKGLNPNDVTRLDDTLGRTPMVDLVGGIPDFSSTRVRIEKIV